MSRDAWDSAQYERFRNERDQPFYDLMARISPRPGMRVLDLGCGTGKLTAVLHQHLKAAETVGVDNSANMLLQTPVVEGLRFEQEDMAIYEPPLPVDLLISNAALHWIPDHPTYFQRLASMIAPGGQFAFQFPNNGSHPVQQVAYALEKEPPFDRYPGNPIDRNVLRPEEYAGLLHMLGLTDLEVDMHVYIHPQPNGEAVIEWVKGSFLTHYRENMPAETYELFLAEFRRRVHAVIAPDAPYVFTFKRIFLSGKKPEK